MKSIKYPFRHIQKVAWGDMDAYGHVNHLAYGKYFETARGYYFSESKLSYYILNSNVKQEKYLGIPLITHLEIHCRQQVSFPIELEVTVGIINLKKRYFQVMCSIWDSNNQCVVTAKAEFLWFSKKKNRTVLLPLEVFMELQNLEKIDNYA